MAADQPVPEPAPDEQAAAEQAAAGRKLRLRGWWRRRGLRARLTLAASAGLAVALAGAGLLLVYVVQLTLGHQVEQTARQGATEVTGMINSRDLPSPVPFAGGTISVQVIGPQGNVTNASPQSDRYAALLPLAQARALAASGGSVVLPGGPYNLPYPQVLVVAQATNDGEIVIAAVSYSQVSASVNADTQAFVIGAPLFFLLLVTSIWLITGAALRPIEELRRGAQEITSTAVGRTLPVPQARDEVASLAVTLNDMLGRLAAAQQRQRALVSDAAHELRSPIASIRTQLEVAVDHPEAVDWQQTAAGVLADTLRLARLAEDLLALARLDERAGRPPRGHRLDLAELVREVCRRYCDAGVVVRPRPYGKCMVNGDGGGLDRMLVNLIDNAVRYASGEVRVAAVADGPWAVLTVTDDGPGIPAGDAERVFDRFTRLDDARSREADGHAGAGLGLAIVRATAAAHGGTAWLEDAGPGLRAVVRLPAADQEAEDLPAAPGQQGGDRDGGEQQGQVRDGQMEQAHRRGR
jgi:signal transduction histidine kinase